MLERSEMRLAEARALAHIASSGWDLLTNRLTWSDEHRRLCGLPPGTLRFEMATPLTE
jgi:hypothetical protein